MLSVAIFGSSRIDGSEIEAGERVFGLALFGDLELDFTSLRAPPALEIVLVSVFGGVSVRVQPNQPVRLLGFSVFGSRSVESRRRLLPTREPGRATNDDEDDALPLDVHAYGVFGRISVERGGADSVFAE